MIVNSFRNEQHKLYSQICLENNFSSQDICLVAGVDVAYWKDSNGGEYGVCCIVIIEFSTKKIIEKVDYASKIEFPYIAGFLAFRELPLVLSAAKKLVNIPDLYMFDGNGYLHARHMGIATHASFYLNKPTIGVAKNYLKIDGVELREPKNTIGSYELIQSKNEIYGAVLRTRKNVKPIYVSCGNWIFDSI